MSRFIKVANVDNPEKVVEIRMPNNLTSSSFDIIVNLASKALNMRPKAHSLVHKGNIINKIEDICELQDKEEIILVSSKRASIQIQTQIIQVDSLQVELKKNFISPLPPLIKETKNTFSYAYRPI